MTKIMKFGMLLSILILSQGCATKISPAKIANADYGQHPPANYQEIIKQRISSMLIDPTSPIYEFSEPRKSYTKKSPVFKTNESFGWGVCGTVNSKNRYGGYVGKVPFFALMRDDRIVEFLIGKITNNEYGLNFDNANIQNLCNRVVE